MLTEQDIRELEQLDQGIFPVRTYEFDRVFALVDRACDFVETALADRTIDPDDWALLKEPWIALADVRAHWQAIVAEVPKLGVVGKVTLLLKAGQALKRVAKALKAVKRKVVRTELVAAPLAPQLLVETGDDEVDG